MTDMEMTSILGGAAEESGDAFPIDSTPIDVAGLELLERLTTLLDLLAVRQQAQIDDEILHSIHGVNC